MSWWKRLLPSPPSPPSPPPAPTRTPDDLARKQPTTPSPGAPSTPIDVGTGQPSGSGGSGSSSGSGRLIVDDGRDIQDLARRVDIGSLSSDFPSSPIDVGTGRPVSAPRLPSVDIPTERFDSRTGMFISNMPGQSSGTAISRPPTRDELRGMDRLSPTEQRVFGVDKKSDHILLANIRDLQDRYRTSRVSRQKLEELDKTLSEAEDKIDSEGNWIGSEAELERYNRKINQFNQALETASPTITVGLFGTGQDRDLSQFGEQLERPGIFAPFRVGSETLGTTIEEGYKSAGDLFLAKSRRGGNVILTDKDFVTTPEQEFNVILPYQQKGTMMTDPTTGKMFAPSTNIIIPEETRIKGDVYSFLSDTSNVLGSVGGFAGRSAMYLNPIGSKIFLAEQTERLGFNVMETGGVKSGAVSWFKEDPVRSTIALAIPTIAVGKPAVRYGVDKARKGFQKFKAWDTSGVDLAIRGKKAQVSPSIYQEQMVEVWYKGQKIKVSLSEAKRLKAEQILGGFEKKFISQPTRKEGYKKVLEEFKKVSSKLDQKEKQALFRILQERDLIPTQVFDITKAGTITPKLTQARPEALSRFDILPGVKIRPPTQSVWAGTGLYERAEFVSGFSPRETTQLGLTLSTVRPLSGSLFDVSPRQELSMRIRTDTKVDTKPDIAFSPRTKTDTRGTTISKVGLDLFPRLDTRLETKPKQKLDFRRGQQTKTQAKPKPKPQMDLKIKLPKLFGESKEKKKGLLDEEEFEVFARKKGEDISIAKVGTLQEARTKLKSELSETLRASGFIQKGGKKLTFGEVGITNGFRPGKTEPFRVVEKRERRIKKGGEVREILKARGKKTKRGFF